MSMRSEFQNANLFFLKWACLVLDVIKTSKQQKFNSSVSVKWRVNDLFQEKQNEKHKAKKCILFHFTGSFEPHSVWKIKRFRINYGILGIPRRNTNPKYRICLSPFYYIMPFSQKTK